MDRGGMKTKRKNKTEGDLDGTRFKSKHERISASQRRSV